MIFARLEQCEKHGHTLESDRRIPVETLAQQAVSYSHSPRDHAIPGNRQNIAATIRGAERAAALWWAVADRARYELERQQGKQEGA
jgi:hypothetical protein